MICRSCGRHLPVERDVTPQELEAVHPVTVVSARSTVRPFNRSGTPIMSRATPAEIIVGIDAHKRFHAAVAISPPGARLGTMTVPASAKGCRELEAWARSLGPVRAFGIEGTGSYGAVLSRPLCGQGHAVLEVNRPGRQFRHHHGKDDPIDAEAARAVLARQVAAVPKAGTSTVEMIRHLKVVVLTGVDPSHGWSDRLPAVQGPTDARLGRVCKRRTFRVCDPMLMG